MIKLFGGKNPGVRNFDSCKFKQVNTQTGGYTYITTTASLECPRTEDNGGRFPSFETGETTTKPEKAYNLAVERLRQFCGASACKSCVYAGLDSRLDVEAVRQQRASEEIQLSEAREATARMQAEAVIAGAAALVAEQALTSQLKTPLE